MLLDNHNCDGDCESSDCSGRQICPLMFDDAIEPDVDNLEFMGTDVDPNEVD